MFGIIILFDGIYFVLIILKNLVDNSHLLNEQELKQTKIIASLIQTRYGIPVPEKELISLIVRMECNNFMVSIYSFNKMYFACFFAC